MPLDEVPHWKGFEETSELLGDLRPRMAEVTGAPARISWFLRMDPQIEHVYGAPDWVAQHYGEVIARLEQAGDELGLHTHAWRWDEGAGRWLTDHANQQWVNHCITTSFAAYRGAFGRACVSFRFGDHWMSDETMDLLESLGARFDLTVEPGRVVKPPQLQTKHATGFLPDYVALPRSPYRPSRRDFRTHDAERGRGLWAIPLSTGKEPGRFAGIKRVAEALGVDLRRRHDTVPLNLELRAPLFRALLESWLAAAGEKYLSLIVRSDACLPSYSRDDVVENLNSLLAHPLAGRFRFSRPGEAVRLLTES
jgi:hypothetical protein